MEYCSKYNKVLAIVILLISNFQIGFSQDGAYLKGKEGIFYIMIPVEELLIEDGIKEVKEIMEQQGITGIRVGKYRIEDLQFGLYPYIIIRRFKDGSEAESFIKILNENGEIIKNLSIAISQLNYRKYLKRRDIEEYRIFANN